MSRLGAQKLARLQAIVAERAAWTERLTQIKRMHGWLLEVEHILDASLVQAAGESVSNETVGSRLDAWRECMVVHLTDDPLSQPERECLTEFLQGISNLRLYLVQGYDRQDFPRTVPRHGAQHSWAQDPVSSGKWAQELEGLSLALRALCGLRSLVGARYGPSPASATAGLPA